MRIVKLRRNRLVNLVLGATLFLVVFYAIVSFFSDSQVPKFQNYWAESLRNKRAPVFVKDLGNFEPRDIAERTGPGEGGKPHILRDDQKNDVQESESDYGMNMVCSNEISLDRSVPDTRPQE